MVRRSLFEKARVKLVHAIFYRYVKDAVPAMFIASLLFIFPSKLPQVLCCRSEGNYFNIYSKLQTANYFNS